MSNDPTRAAKASMRAPGTKRFFKDAGVTEAEGSFALALDGRLARTPARNRLGAANRALMERVAEEWRRQGETIDPSEMPLTRLLNSAIDGVAGRMEETRDSIAAYAASDLLCYRAEEPESLAERQRQAFDPALDWAADALGARFRLAAGVMPIAQPPEALSAVRAALDNLEDPVALAALSVITTLTGSALLALAVANGAMTAEEAWRAAHVDEDFQAERWGMDAEAVARREARWREMEAAAIALGRAERAAA